MEITVFELIIYLIITLSLQFIIFDMFSKAKKDVISKIFKNISFILIYVILILTFILNIFLIFDPELIEPHIFTTHLFVVINLCIFYFFNKENL